MVDRAKALNLAKCYVDDVRSAMPIDKVFLYGSYAKGLENENSDIDVCFFSDYFENQRKHQILVRLLDLCGKYYQEDVNIEPNIFCLSDMYTDNPFVKEIIRTGVEL